MDIPTTEELELRSNKTDVKAVGLDGILDRTETERQFKIAGFLGCLLAGICVFKGHHDLAAYFGGGGTVILTLTYYYSGRKRKNEMLYSNQSR